MTRWLLLLVVPTVACGGASLPATTIPSARALPGARSLVDIAPAEARSFLFVDLRAIRATPLHRTMDETIRAWNETLEAMAEREVADADLEDGEAAEPSTPSAPTGPPLWEILSRPDWIFVATDPRTDPPAGVSFLGAHFTEEEARELVRIAAGGEQSLPVAPALPFGMGAPRLSDPLALGVADEGPVEVEAVRVYGRDGFSAREYRVVEATPGVWVLGTDRDLAGVLERWDAPTTPSPRAARIHDHLGLFDHHLVFAVEDAPALQRLLVGEDTEEELPGWVQRVESGGLRVDLAHGVQLGVALQTASPRHARATAREAAASLRDAIENDRFVALFGLRAPLRRVTPRVEEGRVWMDVELDELESHTLWGRLSGVVSASLLALEAVSDAFRGVGSAFEGLGSSLGSGASLSFAMPTAGFYVASDPVRAQEQAGYEPGGRVDAAAQSGGCVGFIGETYHPLVVEEESGAPLRVMVHADADLTLAVELEDGTWVCSDDADGTDPVIEHGFSMGTHRIFVGTRTESAPPAPYAILMTPDPSVVPSSLAIPPPSGRFGDVTLEPGFQPDPFVSFGSLSGSTEVASERAPNCVGRVPRRANHVLDVRAPMDRVRVLVRSNVSTTLVVQGPGGLILCDDASAGEGHPMVEGALPAGIYEVFVGAEDALFGSYTIGVSANEITAADLPEL